MSTATTQFDVFHTQPERRLGAPIGTWPDQALPAGALLGRYRLERRLGQGGMGVVYEAVHTLLRKRVAIKVMHDAARLPEGAFARFLREAESAARVSHPNVVDITDLGVEGKTPFMVMELLEGEDLAALLSREGRFSPSRAVDLILPVVAGLAAAHRLGIRHGDIKPENIFVARDARGQAQPKLLDFGLSAECDTDKPYGAPSATVSGTPYYLAPEQLRGAAVDLRTDQYALGVTLCQCLTERPRQAASLATLLIAIDHYEARAADELARARVPKALAQVILRAMARDIEDRYPDVEQLGKALLPFASDAVRSAYADEFAARQRASTPPPSRLSEEELRRCCDALLSQAEPRARAERIAAAWSETAPAARVRGAPPRLHTLAKRPSLVVMLCGVVSLGSCQLAAPKHQVVQSAQS